MPVEQRAELDTLIVHTATMTSAAVQQACSFLSLLEYARSPALENKGLRSPPP